jgi:hypothetical protein
MDSLPQQPYSVATIEGSGKQKRDFMLRVRLSPTEVYTLNAVVKSLGLSESATIRWLVDNYPEIVKARAITTAYEAKLRSDADFEALMKKEKAGSCKE